MGRPKGSASEIDKLRKSRDEWHRTQAEARDQINAVLVKFRKTISEGDLTTEGLLEVLTGLKDIALTAGKAEETLIKSERAYDESGRDPEETEDAIITELSGGRG